MNEIWVVEWLHPEDVDEEENWQFRFARNDKKLAEQEAGFYKAGHRGQTRVRRFIPA